MVKIVELTTPDCSVCKMIAPMVAKTVAEFPADKLSFFSVNALEGQGKALAEKHGVHRVPTFFFLNEANEVTYRHEGAINPAIIREKVNAMLG
ncbi:MAG: thioredoxin family protein [Akkermansia sp.]|nr:thioredoxin family protein [Akkermansia sp.]